MVLGIWDSGWEAFGTLVVRKQPTGLGHWPGKMGSDGGVTYVFILCLSVGVMFV